MACPHRASLSYGQAQAWKKINAETTARTHGNTLERNFHRLRRCVRNWSKRAASIIRFTVNCKFAGGRKKKKKIKRRSVAAAAVDLVVVVVVVSATGNASRRDNGIESVTRVRVQLAVRDPPLIHAREPLIAREIYDFRQPFGYRAPSRKPCRMYDPLPPTR